MLSRTKEALRELRLSLVCRCCKEISGDIFSLGQCEHRFCRRCVGSSQGKACPLCQMPSYATQAHVDKQMSNLASLCQQMMELFEESPSETSSSSPVTPGPTDAAPPTKGRTRKKSSSTSSGRKAVPSTSSSSLSPPSSPPSSRRRSQRLMHTVEKERPVTPLAHHDADDDAAALVRNGTMSQHSPSFASPPAMANSSTGSARSPTPSPAKVIPSNGTSGLDGADGHKSGAQHVDSRKRRTSTKRGENGAEEDDATMGDSPVGGKKRKPNKQKETDSSTGEFSQENKKKKTPNKGKQKEYAKQTTPNQTKQRQQTTPNQRKRNKATTTNQKRQNKATTPNQKRQNKATTPNQKRQNKATTPNQKRQNKAKVVKRNIRGEAPLHVATLKADLSAVRTLLEKGANPNLKDNAGWTPLHEAVNHGLYDIAKLLIEKGALVNAPGLANDTPLHDAVGNHRVDCVKLLLSRGANAQLRNVHGRTPVDLAQTHDLKDLLLASVAAAATSTSAAPENNPALVPQESPPDDEDDGQPLCLLGSSLNKEEKKLLQQCASLIGAKVVAKFSTEVTHLITTVNNDGICPRTEMFLWAILCGKWIVSSDWLHQCCTTGGRRPEAGCQVKGSYDSWAADAPLRARTNRTSQHPGLFDGCQMFFFGAFHFPNPAKKDLMAMAKAGGATILTRQPRLHNLDDYPYTFPYHAQSSKTLADCAIFIIYDDACPNPPQVAAQRMTCRPASWLLDSICNFCFQEN